MSKAKKGQSVHCWACGGDHKLVECKKNTLVDSKSKSMGSVTRNLAVDKKTGLVGVKSFRIPTKGIPVANHAMAKHHAAKVLPFMKNVIRAQAVSDSFVDAKTGKVVSSWADQTELDSMKEQLGMMRSAARAAVGGKHVRATLYEYLISASSANTAIASTLALQPSGSSEWTAFSGLYDEVRVLEVRARYVVGFNVPSTGPTGGSTVLVGLGYDSTYATVPGSVTDVLESEQHHLSAAAVNVAYGINPDRMTEFHVKIPKGPVANATPVTGGIGIVPNFPGEWMAMGDGADTVGYHRFYVDSGGATCVMGYRMIREYHCEFRERT